MFTDLVGYTALIAEDEGAGLAARERHRGVLEKSLPDRGGKLLQYFGDGSLSIFLSAVEGVTASIEIQRELQASPKLPVRIGLHVGDIAYDEQGAYGAAVNVASRLEALCVPGGILISGKIVEEIKNQPRANNGSPGLSQTEEHPGPARHLRGVRGRQSRSLHPPNW